jgi:hypothetical protein
MSNASASFHGRRFDDDQAGTRICELRQMLQMPVGRGAVTCAVLTHRRNDEAVRQLDLADRHRLEQEAGHEHSRG